MLRMFLVLGKVVDSIALCMTGNGGVVTVYKTAQTV